MNYSHPSKIPKTELKTAVLYSELSCRNCGGMSSTRWGYDPDLCFSFNHMSTFSHNSQIQKYRQCATLLCGLLLKVARLSPSLVFTLKYLRLTFFFHFILSLCARSHLLLCECSVVFRTRRRRDARMQDAGNFHELIKYSHIIVVCLPLPFHEAV